MPSTVVGLKVRDVTIHEHPREVFIAGCSRIAEALKSEGFRFQRSGPKVWKARGDWRFEVSFQSDRLNIAGEYVCMIVHAAIRNESVLEWERRVGWPLEGSDFLVACQMGNVQHPHRWLEFNIADPCTRDAVIKDIITKVQDITLPFFARFDEPQALARELLRSPDIWPPGLEEPTLGVLRFVFWQLGPEAAEEFLASTLNKLPKSEGLELFRMRRDHPGVIGPSWQGEPLDWSFSVWLVERLGDVARATGIGSSF